MRDLFAVWFLMLGSLTAMTGQSPSMAQSPLHRQYRAAATLAYQMHGVNESWEYTVRADGMVKQDSNGRFAEEYQWSKME